MNHKSLSILGYLILVMVLLELFARDSLLAAGLVFITIQVLAASLMIWARITFGHRSFHLSSEPTQGGLITTGPYKYIRHPIYAAIIYFVTASVLSHLSPLNIALWAACCAAAGTRMYSEEILLRQKYSEYTEYSRRTKRIIPSII